MPHSSGQGAAARLQAHHGRLGCTISGPMLLRLFFDIFCIGCACHHTRPSKLGVILEGEIRCRCCVSVPLSSAFEWQEHAPLVCFWLDARSLPVEIGRHLRVARVARVCLLHPGIYVGDERHDVFDCPSFDIRIGHSGLSDDSHGVMRLVMWHPHQKGVASCLSYTQHPKKLKKTTGTRHKLESCSKMPDMFLS